MACVTNSSEVDRASKHNHQIDVDDQTQVVDMDFHSDESSFKQLSDSQAIQVQKQASINTIPPELVEKIMRELTPCMRACLGVTCREMYKHFKYVNPELVELCARDTWDPRCAKSLFTLLKTWMGPQYRGGRFDLRRYLLISVYGEQPSDSEPYRTKKEDRLLSRYYDYHESREGNWLTVDGIAELPLVVLPSPCNKGDDWDKEAFEIIKQGFPTRPNQAHVWAKKWRRYGIWQRNALYFTTLVSGIIADEVLSDGLYTEWIEMTNF